MYCLLKIRTIVFTSLFDILNTGTNVMTFSKFLIISPFSLHLRTIRSTFSISNGVLLSLSVTNSTQTLSLVLLHHQHFDDASAHATVSQVLMMSFQYVTITYVFHKVLYFLMQPYKRFDSRCMYDHGKGIHTMRIT